MRKFTKTHNNLEWLFPSPENPSLKESESYFDMYEYQAYNLFEIAHPQLHCTFSKDDVIDAFMKGASEAHNKMVNYVYMQIQNNKTLKDTIERQNRQIETLYKMIEDLSAHYKK